MTQEQNTQEKPTETLRETKMNRAIISHFKQNLPAYLFGALGFMALLIGNNWLNNIENTINSSVCTFHETNLERELNSLYSMVVETPTEYIDLGHPAITGSNRIFQRAAALKENCDNLNSIENRAKHLNRIMRDYANSDFETLVNNSKDIGNPTYVSHHLVAGALNRLAIQSNTQEERSKFYSQAKQHVDRAISLFQQQYSGIRPHLVLQKMKCNALSVDQSASIDERIECAENLLGMNENPTIALNLATLKATRGILDNNEQEKQNAVDLFVEFSIVAPYNICRNDIMKSAAWQDILADGALGPKFQAALTRLKC